MKRGFALMLCLSLPVSAAAQPAEVYEGYKYYDPNRLHTIRITVEPETAKCVATQNKKFVAEANVYPTDIWYYPNNGPLRIDCSAEGYSSTFSTSKIKGYLPENAGPEQVKIRMYPKGKVITPYGDELLPKKAR